MDQQQSSPASRLVEVAEKIVEGLLPQVQGIQGMMIKPMLTNYMGLLTSSISDEKAIEICGVINGFISYVEGPRRAPSLIGPGSTEEGVSVG